MQLADIKQVNFEDLSTKAWDLTLAVSGYEARSSFLATRLSSPSKQKIVLAYRERKDHLHRPENDRLYKNLQFTFVEASENSAREVKKLLEEIFSGQQVPETILIDYSCMQKEWYAEILRFFLNLEKKVPKLSIYFSYTPSEFVPPAEKKFSWFRKRKIRLELNRQNAKPPAIILGLGFEKTLIENIYKQSDISEIWLCYADPAWDRRFVDQMEEMYADLISRVEESRIVRYPLQNLEKTFRMLTTLALDLRIHHNVILAPFGPKPFILTALMVGARYPDIRIWTPDENDSHAIYDWKPLRDPQVFRSTFVPD